ncbi:carbohydrate esterase family 9 protein [Ramaria rubella]|nr:carbohydrate esterase family 9 protein [Ramaria rubella]
MKSPFLPERQASPCSGHIYHARLTAVTLLSALTCYLISSAWIFPGILKSHGGLSASERKHILGRCQSLNVLPGQHRVRSESDRFVAGTNATLLRNGKVSFELGRASGLVYGDILLDKGLVKAVGYISPKLLASFGEDELSITDLGGSWVTPGLVDLHSHIGVGSVPSLKGASDGNSFKAPILPWLRSLDALNTHDDAYALSIAGGVTTTQVLPGSANNIGGQAFVIKLRPTAEGSSISKVIEPPHTLNGTDVDPSLPPRWRHMKHACGENPSRTYSATRMDSAWAFREAYNEARKIRDAQDAYCAKAEHGKWKDIGAWPEELKWEALVDVLRGRVKLAVHCYEPVDFDGIVRLTNEFKFPVASFHHAGSAYLVPDLLKKTYGGAPAIALFASNFRKKREAYRGSEFGPRVLADNGIRVVMKACRILRTFKGHADHPVVNSRYLLNEAAVAYYYGLPANLALSSVTSVPAQAAGLDHRVGTLHEDLVIWDSHPLSLGATPAQVYIDGIAQLTAPHVSLKPSTFQQLPETPDFDTEAQEAVKFEGLPPLQPKERGDKNGDVVFKNVKAVWEVEDREVVEKFNVDEGEPLCTVLVRAGKIECVQRQGTEVGCIPHRTEGNAQPEIIDLAGGALTPGLATYGAPVGTVEIRLEPSTNDGAVFDPLRGDLPALLAGDGAAPMMVRAVDGLQFEGRTTLLAHRSGVTLAITAPSGTGFWRGLSTAFSTGAEHALARGAIVQEVAALHVVVGHGGIASVGTEVAVLRRLLMEGVKRGEGPFGDVVTGAMPLVVGVESADVMATLLRLKGEVEARSGRAMQLTFAGAAEAWRLAAEIKSADVGVVLTPSRSFPGTWDQRRILPGPPITYETPLTTLLAHNVTVAIGIVDEFAARNTRFDVAWAALESSGRIDKHTAFELASTNLETLLGVRVVPEQREYVAWHGGDALEMRGKAVAVFSEVRGVRFL